MSFFEWVVVVEGAEFFAELHGCWYLEAFLALQRCSTKLTRAMDVGLAVETNVSWAS